LIKTVFYIKSAICFFYSTVINNSIKKYLDGLMQANKNKKLFLNKNYIKNLPSSKFRVTDLSSINCLKTKIILFILAGLLL
jgi:hypothetical protein